MDKLERDERRSTRLLVLSIVLYVAIVLLLGIHLHLGGPWLALIFGIAALRGADVAIGALGSSIARRRWEIGSDLVVARRSDVYGPTEPAPPPTPTMFH